MKFLKYIGKLALVALVTLSGFAIVIILFLFLFKLIDTFLGILFGLVCTFVECNVDSLSFPYVLVVFITTVVALVCVAYYLIRDIEITQVESAESNLSKKFQTID